MSDVFSNLDLSKIPPRNSVGYLDGEIADEGQKVILSDGEQVSWTPPPVKPSIPDWSQIKSLRKYFGRTGHQAFPAWFYHPTEQPRLMKNAKEAKAELGIFYRQATIDERGRYGVNAVWDWEKGCKWRAAPWEVAKFDPQNPGLGKTYVPSPPNPIVAQNALLEALIPAVAAAVAQSLKSTGQAAPAEIDKAQWEAFLAFQAFQKANEVVGSLKENPAAAAEGNALALEGSNGANGAETERAQLEATATAKGIKVDGRWSLEKLRSAIDKAM